MKYFILFCFLSFSAFADHKGLGILDYSEKTFPCESYAEVERLMEEEGKPEHYYIYAVCQFHRGEISQGIELMRELAEWGDVKAQYFLSKMYLRGREVRESARRAFFWIQLAANQDHVLSQYALGNMYKNGKGVEKNEEMADFWIHKAAEQTTTLDETYSKAWHELREADRQPPTWLQDVKEKTQPLVDGAVDEAHRWFEKIENAISVLSSDEVDVVDGADAINESTETDEAEKTNTEPSPTRKLQ